MASSGSVGVAKLRNTVPPHFSHVTAFGTALIVEFFVAAGQAHQRHAVRAGRLSFAMMSLALRFASEPCKTHAAVRRKRAEPSDESIAPDRYG